MVRSSKNRALRLRFPTNVAFPKLFLGLVILSLPLISHIGTGYGKSHLVTLRADGFTPSSLSIALGETVIFRNETNRSFWPASDIHPSHTVYPEFDPKKPLPSGTSWSFQFNQPGEWGFHDHLSPSFTGRVTVYGNSPTQANISNCSQSKDSVKCWQEILISSVSNKGLDPTFDLIKTLYHEYPDFPTNCHGLTHNIGIATYRLYTVEKNSAFSPKASFCANGFYHGFMEALLGATRDINIARDFCTQVKLKINPQAPDAELQCYHGIGHGATDLYLSDSNSKGDALAFIDKPLKMCETASLELEKLYRCSSGVFNGVANFYITGEHGLTARKDNPLWICDVQPDKYKEPCYGNMNSYLFWSSGNDLSKSVRFVEQITNDTYAIPAITYLSNLSAPYIVPKTPSLGLSICKGTQPRLQLPCLEGLVQGMLEHGTPGTEYKDAISFCQSMPETDLDKNNCFKYALSNLTSWYPANKAKEICSQTLEKYRGFCEKK